MFMAKLSFRFDARTSVKPGIDMSLVSGWPIAAACRLLLSKFTLDPCMRMQGLACGFLLLRFESLVEEGKI